MFLCVKMHHVPWERNIYVYRFRQIICLKIKRCPENERKIFTLANVLCTKDFYFFFCKSYGLFQDLLNQIWSCCYWIEWFFIFNFTKCHLTCSHYLKIKERILTSSQNAFYFFNFIFQCVKTIYWIMTHQRDTLP